MVKIRIQGTKDDLRWFVEILEKNQETGIVGISKPFVNKGTNKYYRVYAEVKKN